MTPAIRPKSAHRRLVCPREALPSIWARAAAISSREAVGWPSERPLALNVRVVNGQLHVQRVTATDRR
jgi:hypothetical protein